MIQLRVSEAAAHAVVEQSDYFRDKVGEAVALRWEEAVDASVQSLLTFPERGAPCRFRTPRLERLRWIFVTGFPRHMLIYAYDRAEELVRIVHVVYGARDLESLLSED